MLVLSRNVGQKLVLEEVDAAGEPTGQRIELVVVGMRQRKSGMRIGIVAPRPAPGQQGWNVVRDELLPESSPAESPALAVSEA